MADVGKWLADTAKESVGVNDFKKAKDAYNRMQSISDKVDGDLGKAVKALPDYAKEAAVTVGDVAMGAGKALVNVGGLVIPALRGRTAAKAITSKITPKIQTPYKGGVPGRQFSPNAGKGGTATMTKPKVQEAKPQVETAPKAETKLEPTTKPETAAKGKGKAATRAATFAAGAAAASALAPKPEGDKPWTPSGIV